MNTLGSLVQREMTLRGWSQRRLAEESGVPQPVVSRIINTPDQTPDLATLGKLSKALGVPLKRFIEACGFVVDDASADVDEVELTAMVAAVPELREILEPVVSLRPEDRAAVMTMVRAFVAQVEARKHHNA